MELDLYSDTKVCSSIKPKAVTVAENGTGVDTSCFEAALCILYCGVQSGTSNTFRVAESDDNSTFTLVADADLIGGTNTIAITTANDETIYARGYRGKKRYIRWECSAATSGNILACGCIVLGCAVHTPAGAPLT